MKKEKTTKLQHYNCIDCPHMVIMLSPSGNTICVCKKTGLFKSTYDDIGQLHCWISWDDYRQYELDLFTN